MITGNEIKVSRGILNWSATETANRASVTKNMIQRLESFEDIPPSRTQSLLALRKIFEIAGVEFIGEPGDGPGGKTLEKEFG
jgi:transcriptional regulator with XRE-family HTH domain